MVHWLLMPPPNRGPIASPRPPPVALMTKQPEAETRRKVPSLSSRRAKLLSRPRANKNHERQDPEGFRWAVLIGGCRLSYIVPAYFVLWSGESLVCFTIVACLGFRALCVWLGEREEQKEGIVCIVKDNNKLWCQTISRLT